MTKVISIITFLIIGSTFAKAPPKGIYLVAPVRCTVQTQGPIQILVTDPRGETCGRTDAEKEHVCSIDGSSMSTHAPISSPDEPAYTAEDSKAFELDGGRVGFLNSVLVGRWQLQIMGSRDGSYGVDFSCNGFENTSVQPSFPDQGTLTDAKKNPTIKKGQIIIHNIDITPQAVPKLFGDYFDQIRVVEGSGKKYEVITSLESLPKLEEIDLSNNLLTDLTPLSEVKSLRKINIANNQIRKLSPLTNLKQLRELDVSGNPLGKDEVKNLQAALPKLAIKR